DDGAPNGATVGVRVCSAFDQDPEPRIRRRFMRRWRALSKAKMVSPALPPGWRRPGPGLAQGPGPRAAPPAPPEAARAVPAAAAGESFHYFAFLNDPDYNTLERLALWVVLLAGVAGLGYAGMLVGQVLGADQGTEKMRAIGAAIRSGANAY